MTMPPPAARCISVVANPQRIALRILLLWLVVAEQFVQQTQACPVEIWTFADLDDCTAVSGDVGRRQPTSRGFLVADGTCRETEVLASSLSPSGIDLPGIYYATCLSSTDQSPVLGALQMWSSGCTDSTCARVTGNSPAGTCDRDLTSLASIYSRLSPPGVLVVQDEAMKTNGYFRCDIFYGGGASSGQSVTFAVFGDCNCETNAPVKPPTAPPTLRPTRAPTRRPTRAPTLAPITPEPTFAATSPPQTAEPTSAPTSEPIVVTTTPPSVFTTNVTTSEPTIAATEPATVAPTSSPSITTNATTSLPPGGTTDAPTAALPATTIPPPPTPTLEPPATVEPPQPNPTPSPMLRPTSSDTPGQGGQNASPATKKSSKSTIPMVAGGAVGGAVIVALAVMVMWLLTKRGKKSRDLKRIPEEETPQSLATPNSLSTSQPSNYRVFPEIVCSPSDDISTLGEPLGLEWQNQFRNDDATASVAMSYIRNMMGQVYNADADMASRAEFSAATSINPDLFLPQDQNVDDEESFEELFEKSQIYTSARRPNVLRYEVAVPAGRLGMLLDAGAGIPTVNQIKPDSVFATHDVRIGDHLVAVDEVDVRGMKAIDVSQLIVMKSRQPRRIFTFERRDRGDQVENDDDDGANR